MMIQQQQPLYQAQDMEDNNLMFNNSLWKVNSKITTNKLSIALNNKKDNNFVLYNNLCQINSKISKNRNVNNKKM